MPAPSRTSIALVVLVVLTVVSVVLGHGDHDNLAAAIVVAIGLVKARIVARQFMEVDGGPPRLRMAVDVVAGALGVVLCVGLMAA